MQREVENVRYRYFVCDFLPDLIIGQNIAACHQAMWPLYTEQFKEGVSKWGSNLLDRLSISYQLSNLQNVSMLLQISRQFSQTTCSLSSSWRTGSISILSEWDHLALGRLFTAFNKKLSQIFFKNTSKKCTQQEISSKMTPLEDHKKNFRAQRISLSWPTQ